MEQIEDLEIDRILLATDFSQKTEDAVAFAFGFARCFEAEVLMVHGIEPIADAAIDEDEEDGGVDEFFNELVEKSRRELEELVDRAERRDVAARFHIEIGERWKIIVDRAEKEEADLIMMGRRTFNDRSDVSLGTTSQRVFYNADRPVLTIPTEASSKNGEEMARKANRQRNDRKHRE